ncbi:MAG: hypothetical protein NVV60_00565 [Luteimonas sp.]|nr:hypothetical protein [Luteimonas sp.]
MPLPAPWNEILAAGPGTRNGEVVPPEQRIAAYVAALHARDGVGPTEHNIRETVFERGLHPAQFHEFLSTAITASLVEPYTDDAGTVRYRPATN